MQLNYLQKILGLRIAKRLFRYMLHFVFSIFWQIEQKYQKIPKMFAVKLFDGKHFLHYNKYCFGKEA